MADESASGADFRVLCSWANLLSAYGKAAAGKRGQPAVAAFEHRLEDNLAQLRGELLARTYRPGGYHNFFVHEPKRRLISAAPFRDRVVHHAVGNVMEPRFERGFIADSFANRVGKGTHRALDRAQQLARRHHFVLACDLREFFPSIDHAILRATLARRVVDTDVQALIEAIMASGAGVLSERYTMVWFPGDDLFAPLRPRGLPIGNLTSQFWANCHLDPFDHFVKRELRCPGYVRYVDDLLLFANDKPTLWRWKAAVTDRLARLRLTLHPHTHPRPCAEGFGFLGFTIFPERRRLKRRKGVYFRRKLKRLVAACAAGEVPRDAVEASARGWANHARHGNTTGLRKAVWAHTGIKSLYGDRAGGSFAAKPRS